MRQLKARILLNKEMVKGFYKMQIESLYLARKIRPGQFVEVRCSEHTDPFLRRPLGCHRILKNGIEMLYEIVGKGTELLSHKRPGEAIDIIGPLGNGFTIDHRPVVLVAGGIGVAPLVALAERLAFSVERIAYRKKPKIDVFIGACKKDHILCANDFKKLGASVYVATEDGSKGPKGLITDFLEDFLSAIRYPQNAMIYACGPTGMLKAVARIAETERIPCQVSLEERMACGVGVCLGCPVKVKTNDERRMTNDEYKMVCKDGPVFNAEEIAW
ncbi:MAG: dihydroorotate dehydrogenase electron transfer subunit [Candidatus Omnitrophota bacterium]|nr:dihydroorotate dehydrogenase electron transfer subunit [Candidatus Omnitrophota bacterium]